MPNYQPNLCRRPDKTAFPTRRAAKKAARVVAGRDAKMSVYGCDCGRFHLGHSTADERAHIREIS